MFIRMCCGATVLALPFPLVAGAQTFRLRLEVPGDLYDSVVYDLDTLTGASIVPVHEAATLGGSAGNDAYLRFWDGRVLFPWRGTTFPDFEVPGPGSVDLIGASGPVPQLDTAFLYADRRFPNLSTAIVDGPAEIRDAIALNTIVTSWRRRRSQVSGDPSC